MELSFYCKRLPRKTYCSLIGLDCNAKEQKYLYKILDKKQYDLRKTILLGDFIAIPKPYTQDGKKFDPMFDESTYKHFMNSNI